jgi:hypothetical protein
MLLRTLPWAEGGAGDGTTSSSLGAGCSAERAACDSLTWRWSCKEGGRKASSQAGRWEEAVQQQLRAPPDMSGKQAIRQTRVDGQSCEPWQCRQASKHRQVRVM